MKKHTKIILFSMVAMVIAGGVMSSLGVAQAGHIAFANPDSAVTVVVNVDNTQGGSAVPSTFMVDTTISDTSYTPTPASFSGVGAPASTTVDLGQYDQTYQIVEESSTIPANYIAAYSSGCSGFLPQWTAASCTITNTYQAPVSQADIAVAKTVDNATPNAGGMVNYTVTVTGYGPAISQNVSVQDALPSGLTFMNATASQGTYVSGTGIWTIGTLFSGADATLAVAATVNPVTATTTIANTATATSTTADPNLANNSSTVSITVAGPVATSTPSSTPQADIAMTGTVDKTAPNVGDTVNYTVTVTGLGPAISHGVTVTDILPLGLTFVNATASQGTYVSGTGIWTIGTLFSGADATLAVAATVNAGTAGTTIANTATVNSTTADPNTANNSSTMSFTVAAATTTPTSTPVVTPVASGGGGGGSGGGGSSYLVAINNGATVTASTNVTLSLYGTGAITMEVSNDPTFASSTFIPYATTMPWTLVSGNGQKTVYVKFRGAGNNDIGSANVSISLFASVGQVLGASTTNVAVVSANGSSTNGNGGSGSASATTCGTYLHNYLKFGAKNSASEVGKLQTFLAGNLGTNLSTTGFFGSGTLAAVKQFQTKYSTDILAPWVAAGLSNNTDPSGYVYKMTLWKINSLSCPSLNLAQPVLN